LAGGLGVVGAEGDDFVVVGGVGGQAGVGELFDALGGEAELGEATYTFSGLGVGGEYDLGI